MIYNISNNHFKSTSLILDHLNFAHSLVFAYVIPLVWHLKGRRGHLKMALWLSRRHRVERINFCARYVCSNRFNDILKTEYNTIHQPNTVLRRPHYVDRLKYWLKWKFPGNFIAIKRIAVARKSSGKCFNIC